ncbi:MAG: AMP-dependent synthetase/ligase [Candidatus Scatovivens sp.]
MKPSNKLYNPKMFDNLKDLIKNSADLYSNNNAFIIKEKIEKQINYKHITYKDLYNDINSLGTGLINLGLKNKRIAIIGKNCYEWALSYIAILNGVGITVPLDKGLKENEMISSITRSRANAIIFEKEYIEIIKNLKKDKNIKIETYICMNDIDNKEAYHQILTLKEIINTGKNILDSGNDDYINTKIDPDAMASIVFTSGTSSASKAVMLSHKNIASNIYDMQCVEKVYDTDVNMAFLPFHHMFGSTGILFFLSNGATNVFCDGLRHIQKNLVEYKVSVFVCVPLLLESMYKKIILEIDKQGKTKIINIGIKLSNFLLKFGIDIRRKLFKQIIDQLGGNLRFIISGASGIDKKVAKGFNDFGILTIQGYGLTETSPVLCAENESARKLGSCGIPMLRVNLRIDNPNEDGIGEIVVTGPNVMLGYYENEESTSEVLKDGWFYTGDLGYVDKDGFLFITGRKKNVIVLKNGKNIYPEELENVISNLEYVSESMVYGKPKEDDFIVSVKIVYNEEIIKSKYNTTSEDKIKEIIWNDIKNINKQFPNYKHIKHLDITTEPMIKTTTAKIKRHEEIKKNNLQK